LFVLAAPDVFQRFNTCKPLHVYIHGIVIVVAIHAEQSEDKSEFHGSDSDDCVDELKQQDSCKGDEGRGDCNSDKGGQDVHVVLLC
jgi:hypothetical protein